MPATAQTPTTTPNTTPVPPLNLAANFKQLRSEILAEITAICDSGYYVLGPKVAAFEENLVKYSGAKHALGLSSGTDAILLALMALNIGPGDEVIVPSFTFFATAGCVARVGAKPVFCDIEPGTFNIDVKHAESLITSKTKAIIPVHLYGQLADMDALVAVGKRRNVAIIEDAAQAIGAREKADNTGRSAGTFGEFGCISFYPTKNLGAIGDAGALFTNDAKLFERSKQLRLHGETKKYHHQFVGANFRIDALQAAILNIKLPHLESWNDRRRAVADRYTARLTELGAAPQFVTSPSQKRGRHVYHQYVIRAQRRDELVTFLSDRKIGTGVYYPIPLHQQECFAYLGYKAGQLPHSENAAAEVLGLPIYPELSEPQQDAVVESIAAFYRT